MTLLSTARIRILLLAIAATFLAVSQAHAQFGDETSISVLTVELEAVPYEYLADDGKALEPIETKLGEFGDADDGKFQWLRKKRKQIQVILPRQQAANRDLALHLSDLETGLARRVSEKQLLERRLQSVGDVELRRLEREEERATQRIDTLQTQLREIEARIASLEAKTPRSEQETDRLESLEDRRLDIEDDLSWMAEEVLVDIKDERDYIKQRSADLTTQLAAVDRDIAALEKAIPEMEGHTGALRNLNTKTNQYLNDLDDAIGLLLIPETADNRFKLTITGAFTVLVLIVILGFFVVSWKDQEVRRSIFSSQSGIQFLTLFSLVIAIILFGILNILEGKELAALLGGLSGYILGRVSGIDRAGGQPGNSDGKGDGGGGGGAAAAGAAAGGQQ